MIGLGGTYVNHFLRGYSLNKGEMERNEVCIVRPIQNFLTHSVPILVRMMNNEKCRAGSVLSQMLLSQNMRVIFEKIIEHYIWEVYSIDSERQTGEIAGIVSGAKEFDPNFDIWCREISRIPHVRFVHMDHTFVSAEIIADVAHIRIYNS